MTMVRRIGAHPTRALLHHYGLLPALVESLGGEFIRSRGLADADLQKADVLIVLPPRTADSRQRKTPPFPRISKRGFGASSPPAGG